VFGIVSNLHKFGFYPIVVTRHWDQQNDTPDALLKSTSNIIEHKIYDGYEVYYLPYKSSLRDRFLIKSQQNKYYAILSKVLTFVQLLTEPFSNYFVPFSNLYDFSKQFLRLNKDVKLLFISANPFIQFKFGYHLSKKFNIEWIADYRDSWTTNKMAYNIRFFNRITHKFFRFFEKKWVNSSFFFTSVSDKYVYGIQRIIKVKGYTIYNGFNEIKNFPEFSNTDDFNILYAGNLYFSQPVEKFISFLKSNNFTFNKKKVNLHFAGLGFDEKQTKRILDFTNEFHTNINIYSWLSTVEYEALLMQSDLLLMLPYIGFKGIPTSKLFDYISTKKNILLFGSDHDIIEQILLSSKLGFVSNNENDVKNFIINLINYKSNSSNFLKSEEIDIEKYSIDFQVNNLSLLINSLLIKK
jgi:hypothetical protein